MFGFGGSSGCMQIFGGDASGSAGNKGDCKKEIENQGAVKLGVEVWWGFMNRMTRDEGKMGIVIERFDGNSEIRFQIQVDPVSSDTLIEIPNQSNVFQIIETKTPMASLEGSSNWNYTRLEGDFATKQYLAAVVNDADLSARVAGFPVFEESDTQDRKCGIEFHVFNTTSANSNQGGEFFIGQVHFYRIL